MGNREVEWGVERQREGLTKMKVHKEATWESMILQSKQKIPLKKEIVKLM